MKRFSIIVGLAAAAIIFSGCGGGGGGGGGYVPPPVDPVPPPPAAMDVLYLDDIDGIGMADVPYICDSGSGVTDLEGAFYFYWGDACEFDLFGFDGDVFFSLHIDDADAIGLGGIPFECLSGWDGVTDYDGSFEYEVDDVCTFYF